MRPQIEMRIDRAKEIDCENKLNAKDKVISGKDEIIGEKDEMIISIQKDYKDMRKKRDWWMIIAIAEFVLIGIGTFLKLRKII